MGNDDMGNDDIQSLRCRHLLYAFFKMPTFGDPSVGGPADGNPFNAVVTPDGYPQLKTPAIVVYEHVLRATLREILRECAKPGSGIVLRRRTQSSSQG